MDKVSIITPLYNAEKYLEKTYKSILEQTYQDFEWIVVDDHSSDNSFEIAQNIAKNDPRVKVYQTKFNSGAAVTRNVAIEAATGKYIAFLDSDDLWKPNKLEYQIKYMKENNCVFTYTDYDVLFPCGRIKKFSPKKKYTDYKTLLKRCDIGCLTVMYDVEQIGKFYLPTDAPKREDYALWLDIAKTNVPMIKIPESLAVYRLTEGSVSSKKASLIKYHYIVYKEHEKFNILKATYYLLVCSINKLFKGY